MRYPKTVRTLNTRCSHISGALILMIGFFCVYEVIMRHFLHSPTKWTADFSQYTLIWVLFLASGYAFQAKGHVRVDLFTGKMKGKLRKLCALVAYLMTLLMIIVLAHGSLHMFQSAIELGSITYAVIQIPKWILILAMLIGCLNMAVTVISIIIDVLGGGEEWL